MTMRKALWVVAALTLASIPSTAAALGPRQEAPSPRVSAQAQARTLVKYILAGSIEIPAAAGSGYFDRGLAVDSAGNIYVGQNNESTSGPDIAVLDPSGRLLRQWSAAPFGYGPLIAVGPDGLVYVQNAQERFVRVFTPDGLELVARRIEHGAVNTKDIEVDAAGNVYVVARGRGDGGPYSDDGVFRFSSAGQLTGYLVPRPGTRGDDVIGAVAVAPDGSVYITAYGGQGAVVLFHLDASGKKLPVFDPRLFLPGNYYDVEFANGRLYFSGPLKGPAAVDHTPVAAAVFSPQGQLIDFTAGTLANPNSLEQLAVHGENVYVKGLEPSRTAVPASARSTLQIKPQIGKLVGKPIVVRDTAGVYDERTCSVSGSFRSHDEAVPFIQLLGMSANANCWVGFINWENPCPKDNPVIVSGQAFLGGQPAPEARVYLGGVFHGHIGVEIKQPHTGSVVVKWTCRDDFGHLEDVYEWKGEVVVHDPSGNVLDRKSGRPVDGAIVNLQFSLNRSGPFGRPNVSGFVPQINPQVTGRNGFFGWDVAEGYWRLRIIAFGYKAFTSPVYKVPPEVTGLKLRLRPSPAQQRLLIDPYAGRVGNATVGARRRGGTAGLRLRVVRGRVRAITVRARRFRTTRGVKLRSTSLALLEAYPARTLQLARRISTSRKLVEHRVGKATFTVRRGRVVGIRLGR